MDKPPVFTTIPRYVLPVLIRAQYLGITIILSAERPSIEPVKRPDRVFKDPYNTNAINIDMIVRKVLSLFLINPSFITVQYI